MGEIVVDSFLREQLLDRRQRLESAIAETKETASLVQLLKDVDSALQRMDAGTYGICEACHESVEKERLLVDPLVRYCIDHLTSDQRRALEEDLDLASHVQSELLPKQHQTFAGWEVFYHYKASGPVSGDYCDVVSREIDGQAVFFMLGDASGKGVAASMVTAQLHAIFRVLITAGLPVHELMERANRVLCESTMSSYFATLACVRATSSGEMEVCNAGHCPPLQVRKGEITSIEATGLPLGLFRKGGYSANKLHLHEGDTLFLYSDGLSEARDKANAEYGEARLSRLVGERHALPPRALVEACLQDWATFRSGAPMTDDLSVMAIRRVGTGRTR